MANVDKQRKRGRGQHSCGLQADTYREEGEAGERKRSWAVLWGERGGGKEGEAEGATRDCAFGEPTGRNRSMTERSGEKVGRVG